MEALNPNQKRKRIPGLLLSMAYPFLRAALALAAPRKRGPQGVILFQAYQVGDFFMALPAIIRLHRRIDSVTVICRPDCLFLLRSLGIDAIAWDFPCYARPSPGNLLRAFAEAWRHRSKLPASALDFQADPRAAFFLKLAGVRTVASHVKPFALFFDRLFDLPGNAVHQREKDLALAESYLAHPPVPMPREEADETKKARPVTAPAPGISPSLPSTDRRLILSCWTRKDEKNWPLENWDVLIDHLLAQGRIPVVIIPPDGGEDFKRFRDRWSGRIEFLETDLEGIHAAVTAAAAVIATDNFLGHMAAHLAKPVFWINGSSDPSHVRPYGPSVTCVQLDPMPCRPCGHRCVNVVHRECLIELRPSLVLPRLDGWLQANRLK